MHLLYFTETGEGECPPVSTCAYCTWKKKFSHNLPPFKISFLNFSFKENLKN